MNIEIANLDNLTEDEKETFNRLVEKANRKSKVFKPEKNKNYYFITANGVVEYQNWDEDCYDDACYELGNCFETEEQAEFAIEKQKVYMELKRYALEHNEREIDWSNIYQAKWCIIFNHIENLLQIRNYTCNEQIGQIYFTSKEIAQNAIQKIGEDRIKKYLFEVKDVEQNTNG